MPTFEELLDHFAGGTATAPVETEFDMQLSRWSRFELPDPDYVRENALDKLSRPAL